MGFLDPECRRHSLWELWYLDVGKCGFQEFSILGVGRSCLVETCILDVVIPYIGFAVSLCRRCNLREFCNLSVERCNFQEFCMLNVERSCFQEFCSLGVGFRYMRVFCRLRVADAASGSSVTWMEREAVYLSSASGCREKLFPSVL